MKRIKHLFVTSMIATNIFAQQPPTPNPSADPASGQPVPQRGNFAWYRGGNSTLTGGGTNNIFGTLWNSPVYHFTSGLNRMILFDNTFNNANTGNNTSTPNGGGLAINLNPASPITQPLSLLHIGESGGGGWRNWMQVGTYSSRNSDNMFVGLKNEFSPNGDRQDAVINWGDNTTIGGANFGPDYLRFIFTSPQFQPGYPPYQSGANGLEVMRMNWQGRVGMGNYYNNTIEAPFSQDPARRFEILSDKTLVAANGNPLLRLTHSQQDPLNLPNTGLYSEFEPRNTGDLFINTRDNTQTNNATRNLKERYIGINTNAPGNTMEINSQFVNSNTLNGNTNGAGANSTGWAGLRFTDLKSTSVTQSNPGVGLLSVDANGDVIYVDGGGLANANNGVSVNAGVVQLGVPCTLPGGGPNTVAIFANALTADRVVANRNQNFWFASLNNETGGVGVGGNPTGAPFCNVGNTFEVSANAKNPQYPIAGGASGMRFTKLISTSPTIPNGTNGVNSAKVLTVDGDGDVVLTDAASGNFGNTCGAPIAQSNLPTDWRVGMNNFSVNFVGTGNVNIGDIQNCIPGSTSQARLWVRNSFGAPSPNTGFRVDNNSIPGAYAGYFASGDLFCTGAVFGNSSSTFSDKNIKTNVNTITNSMAVISKLRAVSYKYDNTYAPQLTFDGNTNYGFIAQEVAAIVPELVKTTTVYSGYDSFGNAVGSDVPLKALNYDAIIPFAVGAIQEINSKQKEMQANIDKLNLSDAQVKTNVNSFNALATVKTLSPVKYNFTNANVPQLSFKSNTDYGFIAQQLETVYPELVDTIRVDATYDSLGVVVNPSKVLKTVNYKAMSALLVRSVQEQQQTIDSLRNTQNAILQQLAALASQINACCSNSTTTRQSNSNINQLDIELSDKDAIVLNQNVPNPFAEQTTITYNVPASVGKAQIIFFNNLGQIIQTVDIKTRGKGKVNVFASDLSSGLYNYSLVADGKVIDSKKMVRE